MPHYKCDGCRIRVAASTPDGSSPGLCPGCGFPLDPAVSLEDIVGFRAEHVRAAPGESARWSVDDDEGFEAMAEAAALALPDPSRPPIL